MSKKEEQEIARRLNADGWRFVEGNLYCPIHAPLVMEKFGSGANVSRWTRELVVIWLSAKDGYFDPQCGHSEHEE